MKKKPVLKSPVNQAKELYNAFYSISKRLRSNGGDGFFEHIPQGTQSCMK